VELILFGKEKKESLTLIYFLECLNIIIFEDHEMKSALRNLKVGSELTLSQGFAAPSLGNSNHTLCRWIVKIYFYQKSSITLPTLPSFCGKFKVIFFPKKFRKGWEIDADY